MWCGECVVVGGGWYKEKGVWDVVCGWWCWVWGVGEVVSGGCGVGRGVWWVCGVWCVVCGVWCVV